MKVIIIVDLEEKTIQINDQVHNLDEFFDIQKGSFSVPINFTQIDYPKIDYIEEPIVEKCVIDSNRKNTIDVEMIKSNPCNLKDIENQTEQLCITAVKLNGNALKYVKVQTPDIVKYAVETTGTAIKYVLPELITLELCINAIEKNAWAFEYLTDYQTPELCMMAVLKEPLNIRFVKELTGVLCEKAVELNGFALKFIPKELQSEKMCITSIKQNKKYIEFVKNETVLYIITVLSN